MVVRKQESEAETCRLKEAARSSQQRLQELQPVIQSLRSQRSALKSELLAARQKVKAATDEEQTLAVQKLRSEQDCKVCDTQIAELKTMIEEKKARIAAIGRREPLSFEFKKERRNLLQELKGNIRVFCRVKPMLQQIKDDDPVVTIAGERSLDVRAPLPSGVFCGATGSGGAATAKGKMERFSLDYVFGPASAQRDVFAEVSPFIKSALDGYNVCIFAYGQTGSGKTHTMEGDLSNPERYGIIPRSVTQIFETVRELEKWGWKYGLEVSFQEIYNEKLIDLLCKANAVSQNTGMHSYQPTQKPVASPEELFELVRLAADNRTTAETQYNMTSSRSHSIFQIKISGANKETGETHESFLNLIDLAGSESLDTLNKGKERELETKSINKSLSALKDVITALAERRDHIPIRNSKLTYLLKDSLGGNCKTLMFVMVSAQLQNVHQTIQSLRFASKVNSCYVGPAKRG